MSGKRNDLVDLGIIEMDLSRPLGPHDRKLYPSPGLATVLLQNLFNSTQNQVLGGTTLTYSARLEATV
jgi:hypothetical protein